MSLDLGKSIGDCPAPCFSPYIHRSWRSPGRSAYKAGMGVEAAAGIDAWLRNGGLVVTASERAARSLTSAFHRARRAEGLTAWPAPSILDWQNFVRNAWNERSLDGRFVLNTQQEQSLWAGIAATGGQSATLLEGPRHRLAALAMDAHSLLCAYSPRLLNQSARGGWDRDAAAFSAWLAVFDETCGAGNLISPARLPLELIDVLEADNSQRAPLLLAGFDRILPTQRKLFDAWGKWSESLPGKSARDIHFHSASDPAAELAACALWCKRRLIANPNARLLVVAQDAAQHRGEMERAFLRYLSADRIGPGSAISLNFRSVFHWAKFHWRAVQASYFAGSPAQSKSMSSIGSFRQVTTLPTQQNRSL